MVAAINSPSNLACTMDYQTECTFALEPSITGLLDKAELAGWDRQQAVIAVLTVASLMLDEKAPPATVTRHS